MIKLVLDKAGTLLAVEDTGAPLGVVRGPMSLARFVAAVREEFPHLEVVVAKETR